MKLACEAAHDLSRDVAVSPDQLGSRWRFPILCWQDTICPYIRSALLNTIWLEHSFWKKSRIGLQRI